VSTKSLEDKAFRNSAASRLLSVLFVFFVLVPKRVPTCGVSEPSSMSMCAFLVRAIARWITRDPAFRRQVMSAVHVHGIFAGRKDSILV